MRDQVDDDGCLSSVLQRPFLAMIQVIPVTDISIVSLLAFNISLDIGRTSSGLPLHWRSIRTRGLTQLADL